MATDGVMRHSSAPRSSPVSRDIAGRFRPGQTGNAGGRPREVAQVRELARKRSVEAVKVLTEIMLHGKSEAARIAAATALLDRGYGRPLQETTVIEAGVQVHRVEFVDDWRDPEEERLGVEHRGARPAPEGSGERRTENSRVTPEGQQ